MAIFSNSLASLVERVVRIPLKQTWYGGTATGGSTSTLIDTNRYEKDDFFQNTVPPARIYVVSTTDGQAPIGEERQVTDWVQSTGTATVGVNFSAPLASGDTYIFLSEYQWHEIREAINMAIDSVAKGAYIPRLDETITLESSTYEYTIPDGFVTIHRVSMADDNDDFPDPIPADQYKIVRGGAKPKLHLYRFPVDWRTPNHWYGNLWGGSDITANRILRIEGFSNQVKLVTAQDLCLLNPDFVCYQAAAYLHASRINQQAADYDANRTQYQVCQDFADRYRRDTIVQFPPNTKKVEL